MNKAVTFEIKTALKKIAKNKGFSYRQIAQKINVSEQTVKRLFMNDDFSIGRILEICNVLNISFYNLLEIAQQSEEKIVHLSQNQENFLAKNKNHFFFLRLITEDYSIQEIKEKYNLSRRDLFFYLRDLDRHQFIELAEHENFRLLIKGKIKWRLDGPLGKQCTKIGMDFVKKVMRSPNDKSVFFSSSIRSLSNRNYQLFKEDADRLMEKYKLQSYRDEALYPKEELIKVKWSIASSPINIMEEEKLERYPHTIDKPLLKTSHIEMASKNYTGA